MLFCDTVAVISFIEGAYIVGIAIAVECGSFVQAHIFSLHKLLNLLELDLVAVSNEGDTFGFLKYSTEVFRGDTQMCGYICLGDRCVNVFVNVFLCHLRIHVLTGQRDPFRLPVTGIDLAKQAEDLCGAFCPAVAVGELFINQLVDDVLYFAGTNLGRGDQWQV